MDNLLEQRQMLTQRVIVYLESLNENEILEFNILWFFNQLSIIWLLAIFEILNGKDERAVRRSMDSTVDKICKETVIKGRGMNPDTSTHTEEQSIEYKKYMWWGMTSLCNYCGKEASSFCECRRASYCDRTCQKADWPRHKPECTAPRGGASAGASAGAGTARKRKSRSRRRSTKQTTRRRKQQGGCAPLRPTPLPTPTVYHIEGDNLLL